MSETTLERRLMRITLSENKPMENFNKLRAMLVNDNSLNKTLDNYFDSHSAERNYLSKNGFKRNAFKLIIAHVLYQRFEKYRDKHFGPALLQFGDYESCCGTCSRLNQDTGNAFCATYIYFNYKQQTMPIEEVINTINQEGGLSIGYEKNHSGGAYLLKNRGITNTEFFDVYQVCRTELMQDNRIYGVHEEANNLFKHLNRPKLKKAFIEAIINTIIGYSLINTTEKYKNSCISKTDSRINKDSNGLFAKTYYFFKNHQHIFDNLDYARSFIEHCGFDLQLNKQDALSDAKRVETIDEMASSGKDAYVLEQTDIRRLITPLYQRMLQLNPREKEILELRFGLTGDVETLNQIGKKQGVTQEAIRQIESRAIIKLRKKMEIELNTYY